jgi:hypothetical protein
MVLEIVPDCAALEAHASRPIYQGISKAALAEPTPPQEAQPTRAIAVTYESG